MLAIGSVLGLEGSYREAHVSHANADELGEFSSLGIDRRVMLFVHLHLLASLLALVTHQLAMFQSK
jgi:hypothetical protein